MSTSALKNEVEIGKEKLAKVSPRTVLIREAVSEGEMKESYEPNEGSPRKNGQ
jgi:hypothetical protein